MKDKRLIILRRSECSENQLKELEKQYTKENKALWVVESPSKAMSLMNIEMENILVNKLLKSGEQELLEKTAVEKNYTIEERYC